ncbi:MAG: Proteasome subunit alpha type-4 [Paramarteilia canceri]
MPSASSFSADGRIFQVDYAHEAVSRGTLAVGVTGKDCLVFAIEKKTLDKFEDGQTSQKITKIEDNIYGVISGLNADGRVLMNKAILKGQQYRYDNFQEEMSAFQIAKDISKIKQEFTQSGGKRPFGVSCLIGGIDGITEVPSLYLTEPSGTLAQYMCYAIGKGSKSVIDFFEENYKQNLNDEEIYKLAIQGILQVHQNPSSETISLLVLKNNESYYLDNDKVGKMVEEYLQTQREETQAINH